MASLRDLFKGSPYDTAVKQDTETIVEQDTNGLVHKFRGSEYDKSVKQDTETLIETELKGIRITSLVDINNPLLYGNEAIRIANRTTRTLDTMKEATSGEAGSGGLIGKGISALTGGRLESISDVRNKISDTLGIPEPLIPTRVADKLETGKSVQDILDEKNGTELGKFLKQSGGGTPKAITTNLLGNTIKLGKDKLRGVLFGNSTKIGEVKLDVHQTYTDTNTYTSVKKDQNYTELSSADDILLDIHDTKGINLAKYSPIYGVDRKSDLWSSDLGSTIRQHGVNDSTFGNSLSKYNINKPYTGKSGDAERKQSIEQIYGIGSGRTSTLDAATSDFINLIDEDDVYSEEKKIEYESKDLIPFWIGFVGGGSTHKTHFRAILSGISETVTPTWNTGNFFGNPYEFKTYTGISRNVTFSLKLYCMNEDELKTMWKKVNSLTTYTYPRIVDNMIIPPIIDFRLGHVYNNKIGNISSLSYTFPDDGTWEIDPGIGLLPKIIDISMTIDFIEQLNTENKLYSIDEIRKRVDPVTGKTVGYQSIPGSGVSGINGDFSTSQVATTKTPINTSKVPKSLIPTNNVQTLNTTPLSTNNVVTPKFDNSLPTYSPFNKG